LATARCTVRAEFSPLIWRLLCRLLYGVLLVALRYVLVQVDPSQPDNQHWLSITAFTQSHPTVAALNHQPAHPQTTTRYPLVSPLDQCSEQTSDHIPTACVCRSECRISGRFIYFTRLPQTMSEDAPSNYALPASEGFRHPSPE